MEEEISSNKFPLYDFLNQKLEELSSFTYDPLAICNTINRMSTRLEEKEVIEHYTNISGIILHHYLLENKEIPKNNIYGAKISKEYPLLFIFKKLPEKLQKIIALYLSYH